MARVIANRLVDALAKTMDGRARKLPETRWPLDSSFDQLDEDRQATARQQNGRTKDDDANTIIVPLAGKDQIRERRFLHVVASRWIGVLHGSAPRTRDVEIWLF